jgi:deoxyhypusine synthase
MTAGPISQFVDRHYRHFNAAAVREAAEGWTRHLDDGGVMFVTLAGAMSTAELGVSLAEMIRQDKVHGICCTGANLEEDVFNLVAHSHYVRLPHYRDLTPADEQALLARHLNRVTDTCIPEHEAMRRIESAVLEEWVAADRASERYFPHEFLYRVLRSGKLAASYERWSATCRCSCPAGRTPRSATCTPATASRATSGASTRCGPASST